MPNLNWRDAIIAVLRNSAEPVHYADIADAIVLGQLKEEFGATPAASVNSTITTSINEDGDNSPFKRVGRGIYALRNPQAVAPLNNGQNQQAALLEGVAVEAEEPEDTGLINAFGMFWSRAHVLWKPNPRILGEQQAGSTPVDFCNEKGVYILYDVRTPIYVGRTTDQPLGIRLRQHTIDRLNGRWDRFSWFGVCAVKETGELDDQPVENYGLDMLIVTMEALLIEGLEPPQNRKRGDEFRAVEFLQKDDPDLDKLKLMAAIDVLKSKI